MKATWVQKRRKVGRSFTYSVLSQLTFLHHPSRAGQGTNHRDRQMKTEACRPLGTLQSEEHTNPETGHPASCDTCFSYGVGKRPWKGFRRGHTLTRVQGEARAGWGKGGPYKQEEDSAASRKRESSGDCRFDQDTDQRETRSRAKASSRGKGPLSRVRQRWLSRKLTGFQNLSFFPLV